YCPLAAARHVGQRGGEAVLGGPDLTVARRVGEHERECGYGDDGDQNREGRQQADAAAPPALQGTDRQDALGLHPIRSGPPAPPGVGNRPIWQREVHAPPAAGPPPPGGVDPAEERAGEQQEQRAGARERPARGAALARAVAVLLPIVGGVGAV